MVDESTHHADEPIINQGNESEATNVRARLQTAYQYVRASVFKFLVGALLVFFYTPIVSILYLSFSPSNQPAVPISGFTLKWYNEVFADTRFMEGIMTSFGIGAVVAILGTVLGLMAAYTIVRSDLDKRLRGLIGLAISLPLLIPTVVIALAIGVFTGEMGIGFGIVPVVVGHLIWVLPFSTFLLTARYSELQDSLNEAARDLGASELDIFRSITLPLMAPALFASVFFAFALSFNEFLITFFLAGSGLTTMPLEIWGLLRIGEASFLNAASIIVLLISGGIALLASRFENPL